MTGGENTIFAASSLAACAAYPLSSVGKPRINQMRRRAALDGRYWRNPDPFICA
jgi:hypothetical protein